MKSIKQVISIFLDDVQIRGAGVDSTIIDMNKLYKAFHIQGVVELRLYDLTIVNSSPDTIIIDGASYGDFGAIRNDEGILRVTDVKIHETKLKNGRNNYHIYNRGQAYLTRVELSQRIPNAYGNVALYNSGQMEINYAHIHDTYGVLRQEDGTVSIFNSLIVDNYENTSTGELFTLMPDAERLTIEYTTISNNNSDVIFRVISSPVEIRSRNSIFDMSHAPGFNVCASTNIVNIGKNLYSDSSCEQLSGYRGSRRGGLNNT